MEVFGKILIIIGVVIVFLGGLIYLLARGGVGLGQLPGDIRWQSGNMTCVVALGTSLLLSVVLTIVLNIIIRLLNR